MHLFRLPIRDQVILVFTLVGTIDNIDTITQIAVGRITGVSVNTVYLYPQKTKPCFAQ